MAQITDPTSDCAHILCCYMNATSLLQIVRISNIPNWYFERAVFPGQRLLFEAPPDAELEIHTSNIVSATLSERIACSRLWLEPSTSD